MENQPQKKIYEYLLRDITIFSAIWFYLWFVIDIKLIYHGAGRIVDFPTFLCTTSYFQTFLTFPGGLTAYITSFLSQLFYYSGFGAAVVALICWINAGLTVNILRCLGLRKFDFLRFTSVLFVVITFALYRYQFQFITAMMIVLSATCLYLRLTIKKPYLNFTFLIILSSLLYLITAGPFYIFAVIALVYLITKSRSAFAVVYALIVSLLPYFIGILLFKARPHDAYCLMMPFHWKTIAVTADKRDLIPAYILYLTLPLIACLVLIKLALTKKYPYLFLKKTPPGKSSKQKKFIAREKIPSPLNQKVALRYFLISLLWIIIFSAIASVFYRSMRADFFLADYYNTNRNWPKVIDIVRKYKQSNYYMTCAADHALSQTGKLSTEMFSIPQHPYSLFLIAPEHIDVHWPKIDLYLDLGFLNLAEHEIAESIEAIGPRPVLLKRLITIFLAKKDYQTAIVYLNQLAATLFERSWANNYLSKLRSDPDLKNDSSIQQIRSVMMSKNFGFLLFKYDEILTSLLDKNPKNKIAFEYLMAWYLLCGDIEKVVSNLDLMDNFDYETIPQYYQQAYLFYTAAMEKKASLKSRKIDPSAIEDYNEIVKNFNLMRIGDERAYDLLSTRYNHSYLVYYLSLPSFSEK